ncbi:MAG: integrase [Terracidiphilus sp.]
MGLYRQSGSKIFAIDFVFHGRRIRRTTGLTRKQDAREFFDNFKEDLKKKAAGIQKKKQPDFFKDAAAKWQEHKLAKGKWKSAKTRDIARVALNHILPRLGDLLLIEVESNHITGYQEFRKQQGASDRTIDIEVSVVRQVLQKYGRWEALKEDVDSKLDEEKEVGRVLTAEQQRILLTECSRSASRGLLPFVVLAIECGARYGVIRKLQWGGVDFVNRTVRFGKDKTKSGTGRTIPLNQRAVSALTFWAEQFPDREAEHYVFPSEKYGLHGTKGEFGGRVEVFECDPKKPVGSISSAWETARAATRHHCPECDGILIDCAKPASGYVCDSCRFETAELPEGVSRFRFHDLRHSCVTRLVQGGTPVVKIAKLVGWSNSTAIKMALRYSHPSTEDLRADVEAASLPEPPESNPVPRFSPRSDDPGNVNVN